MAFENNCRLAGAFLKSSPTETAFRKGDLKAPTRVEGKDDASRIEEGFSILKRKHSLFRPPLLISQARNGRVRLIDIVLKEKYFF